MKYYFLGLTGNIGSGKTTVLNLFKNKGFRTLNADQMVHEMFISTHSCYSQLASQIDSCFKTSFSKTSLIDRNTLRYLINGDTNLLKTLSNIVKPFITEEILKEKKNAKDTIIEVPLLFESSNKEIYDKVILVYCEDEERKRRIKLRNPNWGDEHINTVMNSQMKQDEKIKISDYVIVNYQQINLNEQIDKIIGFIKTK